MPSGASDLPSPLLVSIYAALDDRALWKEALHQICDYIGTPYASIITVRVRPPIMPVNYVIWGMPDEDFKEYFRNWSAQDPWLHGTKDVATVSVGYVVDSAEVCPDEILEESEPYVTFLKP